MKGSWEKAARHHYARGVLSVNVVPSGSHRQQSAFSFSGLLIKVHGSVVFSGSISMAETVDST